MRFAGAAAAIRKQIGARLTGTERDSLERRLKAARRSLDSQTAANAVREGGAWSIEHATRLALEFTDAASSGSIASIGRRTG
jgi:hypothetical protein